MLRAEPAQGEVYRRTFVIPVAFDLRDPLRSGIARVARSMARAFVATAGDRFAITLAGPVHTLEELGAREWGAPSIRLVAWDAPRYSPRAELSWQRVRRETGDAIWYFPHWDVPWMSPPPRFIVTVHDLNHVLRPGSLSLARRVLARRWLQRTASRAARITVVSHYTGEELRRTWPSVSAKVEVIPNGVEPAFFQAAPLLPESIATRLGGGRYMLSVGIRKEHKNLGMGPEVLASIPDLTWIVVGEWFPEWERVENVAHRLGVAKRMIVLDPQPDTVIRSLYAAAGCLFFPSRQEGFGLPILEAYAAGIPVVASTTGASPETAGGLATLCDPNDAAAFTQAVKDTLANGTGPAVRRREYARQFTWDKGAERLAQLFSAVAT